MAEATFRATVLASGRGGGHLVEVPPEAVERLGGTARIQVVVRNDEVPRVVEVPDELVRAFRSNGVAREYFGSLSYSHQRQFVGYITEAKKPETRARRAFRATETLIERASSEDAPPGRAEPAHGRPEWV